MPSPTSGPSPGPGQLLRTFRNPLVLLLATLAVLTQVVNSWFIRRYGDD
jgi:hypothetical protein